MAKKERDAAIAEAREAQAKADKAVAEAVGMKECILKKAAHLARDRERDEALRKIANPIGYLQEEASRSGHGLDGDMAVRLSIDAAWLKGIAQDALDGARARRALEKEGENG